MPAVAGGRGGPLASPRAPAPIPRGCGLGADIAAFHWSTGTAPSSRTAPRRTAPESCSSARRAAWWSIDGAATTSREREQSPGAGARAPEPRTEREDPLAKPRGAAEGVGGRVVTYDEVDAELGLRGYPGTRRT